MKFGWNNVGEHLAGSLAYTAASMARNMYRPQNSQQRRDYARTKRAGLRGRRPGGRAMTYRRKRYSSRSGVLGGDQSDVKSIYRRKRMPSNKRKRWARFVKKIHAVSEKELGLRTVLINDQLTQRNSSNTQSTLSLALYPFASTNTWLNDMDAIGQLENTSNPTAAAGDTIDKNTKVMFQSAVMDITIRNVTDKLTTVDPNPILNVYSAAPEASIELDIYEVLCRKELTDDTTDYGTLSEAFDAYDDKQIGGSGAGIAINDRGASPFEFGSAMGRLGIKILKKTKFFIPNGQTITWQVRDPSRKTCYYGDMTTNDGFNKPGWTKHYFLVYKCVPGITQGSTLNTYRLSLALGVTRKYGYKIEGVNEPRERLLGSTLLVSSSA